MAHDVFISYAFEDRSTADDVCAELEAAGVRCWIAPRDILPGVVFSEAIIHALNGTRILVLVFTARSNESPHVMREVERAVNRGIPIIPLRMERVALSPSMEYYISTPHWLDALTPPLKKHLVHLTETVRLLLERADRDLSGSGPRLTGGASAHEPRATPTPVTFAIRGARSIHAPWHGQPRRALLAAGLSIALVVAIAAFSLGGRGAPASTTSAAPGLGSGPRSSAAVFAPGPTATATPSLHASAPPPTATAPPSLVSIEPGFPAPGDWVGGIAWDGSDLWVAGGAEIFRVDEEGRVLGVFDPPDYSPEGLTWDGSRFWLFATNSGTVYRFTLSKANPGAAPSISKTIDSPIRTIGGGINHAIAWDGERLWLSDSYSVYKLDTTGRVLETLAFGTEVAGLAWDGEQIWIATNRGPLDDATLSPIDGEGVILATHEIPIVEVNALTWAGDSFFVAGAPQFGGAALVYRVTVAGAGP